MPELPEVEAIRGRLRRAARGSTIVGARILRPRTSHPQAPGLLEEALPGLTIQDVERRGKHILLQLSGELVLRVHLRMTGSLYVISDVRLRPATTRAYLELDGGRGLIFDDPRALGVLNVHTAKEAAAAVADLGPEPLSRRFTREFLEGAASRSRTPVKLFLMDQKRIAGLGNIYAAESLFRAGIHPATPTNRITTTRLDALHAAIVFVIKEAVRCARISYALPGRFAEADEFLCAVYGREGEACFVCHRKIRRIPQGGRSTYFCPRCQK